MRSIEKYNYFYVQRDANLTSQDGTLRLGDGVTRTPPEIALSILAEMTAAKNGVVVGRLNTVRGAKERENQLGKICEQGVEFLESSCSTS